MTELNALVGAAQTEIQQIRVKISNLLRIAEISDEPTVQYDIVRELKKRKTEENEIEDRIRGLKGEIGDITSREQDALEIASRLATERNSWGNGDDFEVYESRSRLSQALQRTIDFVDFDFETRMFTVIVAGGIRAYRFNDKGELLDKVDLVPLIGRGVVPHLWFEKDGEGHPDPTRARLVYGGGLRIEHFIDTTSSSISEPEDIQERKALLSQILKQAKTTTTD